jgi:mRNA-degrading endonuclease toxin of MazEF toxin-antitoxin module
MSVSQKKRFDGVPGDTLWFHEMYQEIPHLYVVVTPPVGTPPLAVIVNLTSQRAHSDTTLTLHPGDHPFITNPTAVNYMHARLLSIEWLKKEIDAKMAWADFPFEPEVLKRIQDGVLQSPFTPHNIKQHFVRAMGLSADTGR